MVAVLGLVESTEISWSKAKCYKVLNNEGFFETVDRVFLV